MADDDLLTDAEDEQDDEQEQPSPVERDRSEELCTTDSVRRALKDLYARVQQGFADQLDRSNDQLDYWDLYNCKLGPRQTYNGNSQIFVPIIPNAVNARKTRFVNQIFPQSGRYVEVTTSDEKPTRLMSLLEHYVRRSKLRTNVMPALMKNGDVEGQYNIYVSWTERKRHVMWRQPMPVQAEGVPTGEEQDDIVEETVSFGAPHVEVLADSDVLIEPATAESVADALAQGGSVTVLRRWSKYKLTRMIKDGDVDKPGARKMLKEFSTKQQAGEVNKAKDMVDAAGIKTGSGGVQHALIYETWAHIKIDGEQRLCRTYLGGEDIVIGCRRNPNWNDRCPVLSVPVEKQQGSAKGISKVKPCADMQYGANDAINEAMDSAAYALMPIVMTDPLKNPRVGSMILNLAAIWETNPNDTKFAQFPELWKQGFEIVAGYKTEIFQTLSVTPAMMPQSTSGRKQNQAQIANEQQVDMLATADAVTVVEEGILTPILNWMAELDHQHRDKDLRIRQYGEFGLQVEMELIPPLQMGTRFELRWYGVEQARNQAQIQQQIAAMNVVRGIPPQQLPGYEINLVPIVSQLIENTFGLRLAPQIFQSLKAKLSMDPKLENEYLVQGLDLHVHVMDEDQEHMKVHQELMQQPDPTGAVRQHVMRHVQQMQLKQQSMMAQAGQQGMPGGAGPGVAGQPRPGAQPGQPRGGQNPPGAVHRDRMRDPRAAPRR